MIPDDSARGAFEAVILAAGRGSRMGSLTRSLPKALLPLRSLEKERGGETFLGRQIQICASLGIERVVVVVGYLGAQIEAELRRIGSSAVAVTNPTKDIQTSGSLHSLQHAVESEQGVLNGSHQTIVMDSDIVFDCRILESLVDSPERSTVLISPGCSRDEEEVTVWGDIERPVLLGKGLNPSVTGGLPLLGEATGIVKFSRSDAALVVAIMNWLVGNPRAAPASLGRRGFGPAGQATEHEELTQRLMTLGRMRGLLFDSRLEFIEVDTLDDYSRLHRRVYPTLLQADDQIVCRGARPS